MSAFDDLTLGEVDEISTHCLGGLPMSHPDTDPMKLAGGVMWMTQKRANPSLTWDTFRYATSMGDIKKFSMEMEAAELANPLAQPQSQMT